MADVPGGGGPVPIRRAINPWSDSSAGLRAPDLNYGMRFKDYGSYGLRQWSGWVREEFLPQLVGREASRVFREMIDNSSVVGAIMFAVTQALRSVDWRINAADDTPQAEESVDFVQSLMSDMSHTWEDFVVEALSMLGYGFSVHEIVYKRRLGRRSTRSIVPSSDFDDARIGWRRLPIRGQETILKWFFDEAGQVTGMTQQPWIGELIDIPIEKLLLFRPTQHKNNPEGKSILRNSYRSYYLVKRLEEVEAILFERMGGIPVMYIPSNLIDQANAPNATSQAQATYQAYKNLVVNVRADEQMGMVLPSDPYFDQDGRPSGLRMFEFKLETPQHSTRSEVNTAITRHKIDILMSILCDFIQMGHEVRGTNNLGTMKVDMFYAALDGWLHCISSVLNRYALPRIWEMNAFDPDLMPEFAPELPRRKDLDGLGSFIRNIAQSGAFSPDVSAQNYLRQAAGLPDLPEEGEEGGSPTAPLPAEAPTPQDNVREAVARAIVKTIMRE